MTLAEDRHGPDCTEPWRADWMVRDSQAPKYFKSTLETITNDDESDLVSAHIHLTGIAPSGNKDIPYMIALVRSLLKLSRAGSSYKLLRQVIWAIQRIPM